MASGGDGRLTIIGGGILGLSCAWQALSQGCRVEVIEARAIGAGSSGGHVGALAPHVPETWNPKKAFQLDSLLRAEAFWSAVEAASSLPSGYGRTGRVQPVPDMATADRLAARVAESRQRWPAGMAMRLTDDPGTGLVPPSPTGLWLRDGLSARLAPRAALAALAGAIRRAGGVIREGRTAQPQDIAAPVLWATGTDGLACLSRDLGRPVGIGVKGQSALLAHAAPDAPQVFAEGLHIVPHADGTTAIGSTSETRFVDDRPDHQLDALIATARRLCPELARAEVLDRWAGLRPRAQSRAPLLGAWPGRPGHFVANGGFKIGFGMAPAIAAVMIDLILTGRDRIPEGFRLAR
ncbi:NAD(P)/FAD-dependent oxidoreductase [Paracoccus spongiarum]|uniref:FAD-binding oxidoreductase n=1 Tax=Paracoccus spongiarum TaxID=3064387 RepID=A0ABT9JB94_9RHOB|nr:FAD-binding oxidoreductase [Paracoccus sp. 2205BS29-5]MDP5307093.1 FAD-binding oxidoreductase [Paracoccus sp. 2205BS29-5]